MRSRSSSRSRRWSVSGGPPLELGHTPIVTTATWGSDDTILVAAGFPGRTWVVSASGREVRPLEIPNEEESRFFMPLQLLSQEKLLAATRDEESPTESLIVELVSLETGERKELLSDLDDLSGLRFLESGHLVWAEKGALLAARVDVERGEVSGPPVPVLEGLRTYPGSGHTVVVSDSGTLVYAPSPGSRECELTWVDRAGEATPVPGGRSPSFFLVGQFRLSPDGREAAVTLTEREDRVIWVFDLERGTRRRLTSEGVNRAPVWSPDGAWIAFQSNRGPLEAVFRTPSDGSGPEELLFEHPVRPFPAAWSPDGQTLAFVVFQSSSDVWVHSIGGGSSPLVTGPAMEDWAAFSPDGRWVAFESNETGRKEIYVQPNPGPGARTVVSTSGGTRPVWAPGGDEIYYSSRAGRQVRAVRVETTPHLRVGMPQVLFEGPYLEGIDVSPDGERFLVLRDETPRSMTELRVVVNWVEELKRLVL